MPAPVRSLHPPVRDDTRRRLQLAAPDLTDRRLGRLLRKVGDLREEPHLPLLETGFQLVPQPQPRSPWLTTLALLLCFTAAAAWLVEPPSPVVAAVPVVAELTPPLPLPDLYVVRTGDTLGTIAHSQLGTPARWKEIVNLNPVQLKNPNVIAAGMTLTLPPR